MILPTKHIRLDRSLIGLGGEILGLLTTPFTISGLWDEIRRSRSKDRKLSPVSYSWFILCLDFLFIIGAIKLTENQLIVRASS